MNIKDTIESVRKQFRTDSDPFPDDNDKIDSLKIKYFDLKKDLMLVFLSIPLSFIFIVLI